MLNRAHCLHRQAEKASLKGNIEEAIRLHKEAADILKDLIQAVLNEKVQESLRLQAELHEKEQLVLNNQRRRAVRVYKSLERLRVRMNDNDERLVRGASCSATSSPQRNGNFAASSGSPQTLKERSLPGDNLQESIYRKLEETESLLDQLRVQDDDSSEWRGGAALTSNIQTPRRHLQTFSPIVHPDLNSALKRPKDDKVIIEELQIANCHLRKMVDTLFHELNTIQRENKWLKQRVRDLEGQLNERQEATASEAEHTCRRGSSSRSRSARRSVAGSVSSLAQLPPSELPALDLPDFDFQRKN